MPEERSETMITGNSWRLGRLAVAVATAAALVSAGSASAQTAGAARALTPAQGTAQGGPQSLLGWS